jgi:hypothetical protein
VKEVFMSCDTKALVCLGALCLSCAGELDRSQRYSTTDTPAARDAGSPGAPSAGRAQPAAPPAVDAGVAPTGVHEPSPSDDERDAGKAEAPAADSGSPAAVAAACDFRGLMQQKCSGAGCHGAAAATGLDLVSAMLPQRAMAQYGKQSCTDKLLIDTQTPAQSKLYLKVSGSSCGVRMPIGSDLSESEQACVLSWIDKL